MKRLSLAHLFGIRRRPRRLKLTEHQVFYGNGWHRTDLHLRVGTHREDGELVTVSEEQVEHISAVLADRYATRLRRATEVQAPAEPGKDTDRPAP